jgi:serine/threonine protein kinase
MKELSSYVVSPLREGNVALHRGSGDGLSPILLVSAEEPSLGSVERLEHEYGLKAELDADWAARPVALTQYNNRLTLVLEDPGGAPLDRLLGRPLDVSHFLRIAIPLAGALRRMHERGLIHMDIKPANILVNAASGGVWLTGFGIASRLIGGWKLADHAGRRIGLGFFMGQVFIGQVETIAVANKSVAYRLAGHVHNPGPAYGAGSPQRARHPIRVDLERARGQRIHRRTPPNSSEQPACWRSSLLPGEGPAI